ncbi:uncharacterized protein BJX67DRAFT_375711 [Aspergillus lucknowensis]|uniref:PNPLA domain-containing protein n=1 Tax=Aspergillus lucknowensis TaxID=176173 RepID=A0ABR4L8Q8_9EURO
MPILPLSPTRVLSDFINSGGSRGVSPIKFLKELQELLPGCPLHEMVDLACRSSLGGLTALSMFHLYWPIDVYSKTFKSLSAINYAVTNIIYNKSILETILKEIYSSKRAFFAHVPNTIQGPKVAVTVITQGSQHAIFMNYNASTKIFQEDATRVVARATSIVLI